MSLPTPTETLPAKSGEAPVESAEFIPSSVSFAEGEPQSSGSCELRSDRAVRELLGVDIHVEPARVGSDRLRNGDLRMVMFSFHP
jgi:hypothetical protein